MEQTEPIVSVVIPTKNRHQLVVRAVKSALAQTLKGIEVIVVLDGPDEATIKTLSQLDDPRLRIKTLPQSLGGSNARNSGVGMARGRWVAFLDDDDQWFPGKLDAQLKVAQQSDLLYPIIACRLIARRRTQDFVWPRRFPEPEEPLGDYIFCRRSIFGGEGFILPSVIFTAKGLLERVPFRISMESLEDLDWLLRASAVKSAGVEFVPGPEPLAIWHMDDDRPRMSHSTDWLYALSWIKQNRHLVTPRAYASYILTRVSEKAARSGERKFLMLLKEAYRNGRPTLICIMLHMAYWLTSKEARFRIAALFTGIRDRVMSARPKRAVITRLEE